MFNHRMVPIIIFKIGMDGKRHWVQGVHTLDAAKARVQKLMTLWPAEYLIFIPVIGVTISVKPTN